MSATADENRTDRNRARERGRGVFVSLRTRLLIVLLFLSLVPTLAFGGLAYNNARRTVEDRVAAQLTSIADLKKQEIIAWLDVTSEDVRLIADNFLNEEHFTEILDPATDPQRRQEFAAFLTDNIVSVQQARPGYSEIMMVDASGQIVVSTDREHVGAILDDYPIVARVFASQTDTVIEDVHRADDSGLIEMAFGHVMHRVDLETFTRLDQIGGAVIIRVRMDETIYPLIQAWPGMGTTGETLLVRPDGEFTLFLNPLRFDPDAALSLRIPPDSPNALPAHRAAAGQEGILTTPDYRGVQVLAAYRHIPGTGWGFVAKEDIAEAFLPVDALTRQLVAVMALVLPIAILTAALLSRALTRPLARLVQATRSVAAGEVETETGIMREDEIGDLARSFETMAGAVRSSHEELRAHGEELEALFDLSQSLLGTLNTKEALDHAIRSALTGTNHQAGAILLSNAAQTELTVQAAVGLPEELLGHVFAVDDHTAPGYALLRGEPVFTADLDAEGRFSVPPLVRAAGVRSLLAVPMVVDSDARGALVLDSFAPRTISEDELRVAQAIANQTALAVERARLYVDLSDSYDRTLDALVAALDARDNETEGHSRRVVAYTLALARQMDIPESELDTVRRGALLHDIGKIGVPDAILHKPGPLDDDEWALMRLHPELGERILERIRFLAEPAKMVRSHHERWGGGGYPDGLSEEAIPLGARIFAVADTFDAITSDRPYRRAQPYEKARAEIGGGAGSQFDPAVVAAFGAIPPETWTRLRVESLRGNMLSGF